MKTPDSETSEAVTLRTCFFKMEPQPPERTGKFVFEFGKWVAWCKPGERYIPPRAEYQPPVKLGEFVADYGECLSVKPVFVTKKTGWSWMLKFVE